MGRKLVAVGGRRPQLRRASTRSWSAAKGRKFLEVLAETLNVSEALRQSKLAMTTVYRRRQMDAGFRAAWGQAIAEAYSRLEFVLLNRAFNGTEKVTRRRDGSEERMREYPNQLALQLLKMHRETALEAEAGMAAEEVEEIRERIIGKLQRLKRRDEEDEQAQGLQQLRGNAPRNGDAEERPGASSAQGDRQPDG